MKRILKIFGLFCLLLTLTNCEENYNLEINSEGEIIIPFNQIVNINKGDNTFEVEFSKLIEDSRCRPGLQCIWAGRAIIELTINKNDKITLANGDLRDPVRNLSETVEHLSYKIQLIKVSPNQSNSKEEKYTITLKITSI